MESFWEPRNVNKLIFPNGAEDYEKHVEGLIDNIPQTPEKAAECIEKTVTFIVDTSGIRDTLGVDPAMIASWRRRLGALKRHRVTEPSNGEPKAQ